MRSFHPFGAAGPEVGRRPRRHRLPLALAAALLLSLPSIAFAGGGSFIRPLRQVSVVASTVPGNGDVNPYGVAVIPQSVGRLARGNVLVSNFNNQANLQGTGTTIVEVTPDGFVDLFAAIDPGALPGSCPGGVGLTGALAVLSRGWVVVGSLPTADGTAATAQAGCLIVLDSLGQVVETIAGPMVNGPWGMASTSAGQDAATLFLSNVLNGTVAGKGRVVAKGTIVRIDLTTPLPGQGIPGVTGMTVVGSRFPERTDPAALVIGPQGLALAGQTLYVADSLDNRIAAIPNALRRKGSAGTGVTVSEGGRLNDPLGITVAPNGNLLAANGNNGYLVETTPAGNQTAAKLVDHTGRPPGAGCLFDLAITPAGDGVYFADDCGNTLSLLH